MIILTIGDLYFLCTIFRLLGSKILFLYINNITLQILTKFFKDENPFFHCKALSDMFQTNEELE